MTLVDVAERTEDSPVTLLGDDSALPSSEEVEQWISVYTEVLADNRRLLEEITTFSREEVDAEILGRHIHRLEQRLANWRLLLPP